MRTNKRFGCNSRLIFVFVEEGVASRGRARGLSYLQHDAGQISNQNYFGVTRFCFGSLDAGPGSGPFSVRLWPVNKAMEYLVLWSMNIGFADVC
ncbi:hypothetical protein SUGI_1057920 [Cryptomeria japonica]|nr:hypothetical protein SUGI_1057920 [Cryptomeria japonica]